MNTKAMKKPSSGEVNIGISTLLTMPLILSAPVPAATIVAPSRPPMSAWLLELGRPCCQVMRFQAIAPMSAAAIDHLCRRRLVHQAAGDGLGHRGPGERPDEIERGRHEDGVARGQRAGRDRGRDGVRRVVEPVDVIERDGQQDDEDEHGRDAIQNGRDPLGELRIDASWAGVGAGPWYDVDGTESGR